MEGNEIVIDGKNATMGRLASYAAKQALLGKKIIIVNADLVTINGNKKDIHEKYRVIVKKGGSSQKGPRIIRTPERIMKRTIRGMLSHKQGRGIDAYRRIMCYNQIPKEFEEVKKIKAGREKHGKFITLKELARLIK